MEIWLWHVMTKMGFKMGRYYNILISNSMRTTGLVQGKILSGTPLHLTINAMVSHSDCRQDAATEQQLWKGMTMRCVKQIHHTLRVWWCGYCLHAGVSLPPHFSRRFVLELLEWVYLKNRAPRYQAALEFISAEATKFTESTGNQWYCPWCFTIRFTLW